MVLLDVINGIVGQGMFVHVVIQELLEAETVETVETSLGTQPYKTLVVLQDGIDLAIAESVTIVQNVKFHALSRCPQGRGNYHQEELSRKEGRLSYYIS